MSMKQFWGKYDPVKDMEEKQRMAHLPGRAARRLSSVTREAARVWRSLAKALGTDSRKGRNAEAMTRVDPLA